MPRCSRTHPITSGVGVSNELQDRLDGLVAELGVTGAAAGVLLNGQENTRSPG